MSVDITIKNYRCFSDEKPANFTLSEGFTGFVGVNNSGKSSLLKFFYEFRSLFEILSIPGKKAQDSLSSKSTTFNYPTSVTDEEEIFSNKNKRDLEIIIKFKNNNLLENEQRFQSISQVKITILRSSNNFFVTIFTNEGEFNGSIGDFRHDNEIIFSAGNDRFDFTDFFELFNKLKNTIYIGPFRNIINSGYGDDYFDIDVGQSFVKRWQLYKTGNSKKANEVTINLTNNVKHIFGFESLEINPAQNLETLMLFINGKSYKLLEVGAGIAQFILVFANAAIKEPSFILIDEPELNLHPSLQLDFMTSLGAYASEGVLFATHNYGLVRSSADRIYTVKQHSIGKSEISDFEETLNLAQLMGELSYSGYRELGFDKVLLVEGTTEVKTIQQYLRLYKADHKIVLLQMGGKSLINPNTELELSEVKRISNNVYALIDSERSSAEVELQPRIQGFKDICEKLDINLHVLDLRATENYFTEEAIQEIKGPKYTALEPYQKLNEISPHWDKKENWKIARAMTLDDLEGTDLGAFLEKLTTYLV
jgi:ABC-type multidrug transport system ATPase subunit